MKKGSHFTNSVVYATFGRDYSELDVNQIVIKVIFF